MATTPSPDHTTHPGTGGVSHALPRRSVRRQAPGKQSSRRWTTYDVRLIGPGPVHVRRDEPEGKKVHWEAPDGSLGLGDHRLEDLIYVPEPNREYFL